MAVADASARLWGLRQLSMSRAAMAAPKLDISGLYPPIPTPFKPDHSVDYDTLRSNLAKWNGFGLAGYIVQGSNWEYKVLSEDERVEVVRVAKETAGPGKLVIAGFGLEGTKGTVGLGQRMAQAGADAVLVITPKAPRRAEEACMDHFKAVADDAGVPVVLYNMPRLTGVDLSAAQITKLSEHPNIIGLKDSSGNTEKMAMVRELVVAEFQVLAGSAGFLLPAMSVGAVGGVCALANVAPGPLLEQMKLFKEGKLAEAMALQCRLAQPNVAVTSQYGVSGLKHAMDTLGMGGGRVRAPQMPLTDAEKADVERIMKKAELPKLD